MALDNKTSLVNVFKFLASLAGEIFVLVIIIKAYFNGTSFDYVDYLLIIVGALSGGLLPMIYASKKLTSNVIFTRVILALACSLGFSLVLIMLVFSVMPDTAGSPITAFLNVYAFEFFWYAFLFSAVGTGFALRKEKETLDAIIMPLLIRLLQFFFILSAFGSESVMISPMIIIWSLLAVRVYEECINFLWLQPKLRRIGHNNIQTSLPKKVYDPANYQYLYVYLTLITFVPFAVVVLIVGAISAFR